MDRLLTTREAAARVWVDVRTLQGWVRRGLLAPEVPGGAGREALYRESAVLEAERVTRRRPRMDRLLAIADAAYLS
jgi:DNA-binding transcriptional MerR regulator